MTESGSSVVTSRNVSDRDRACQRDPVHDFADFPPEEYYYTCAKLVYDAGLLCSAELLISNAAVGGPWGPKVIRIHPARAQSSRAGNGHSIDL